MSAAEQKHSLKTELDELERETDAPSLKSKKPVGGPRCGERGGGGEGREGERARGGEGEREGKKRTRGGRGGKREGEREDEREERDQEGGRRERGRGGERGEIERERVQGGERERKREVSERERVGGQVMGRDREREGEKGGVRVSCFCLHSKTTCQHSILVSVVSLVPELGRLSVSSWSSRRSLICWSSSSN